MVRMADMEDIIFVQDYGFYANNSISLIDVQLTPQKPSRYNYHLVFKSIS